MKKLFAILTALALLAASCACSAEAADLSQASDKAAIEAALNLANNPDQEWTYSAESDAWTLSVVTAVTKPVIESEEGVSVCVPGAYVTGIDTDGDGAADVTAESAAGAVKGGLVIDYETEVTSTHGQVYTAATAPVILNTGAAGYGNSTSTAAAATYAAEGYVNVSCGNRGKQDSTTDENGNTVYTGDAPACLADQKAAARYVKYNILLGNLPGSVDYWVSTGGSGGGAHAVMFAATSNNPDFYDYQIEVGAVGVYRNADGSYCTTVTIDGEEVELSDGAWGCVGYSPITSLYEADMAMAFEYTLDADYSFNTDFQKALAACLSREYMDYVNAQGWTANESDFEVDLDGDGEWNTGVVPLTIEYDEATDTYSGSYVDLYLANFIANLQDYVDNLAYAEGWTWFDEDGNALSDEDFAAMTAADKAQAFIEGRYDKGSSGRGGHGMGPSGMNGMADFGGNRGGFPGGNGKMPGFGGFPGNDGEMPDFGNGMPGGMDGDGQRGFDNADIAENSSGDELDVGTPDAGTTQAAGSATDSRNYASYDDMLAAYEADIAELEAGDAYGNNPVDLYNPLNYIGAEGTEDPAWMVMLCGAAEGDISMLNSLNLAIAASMGGIDATAEWQWDGGHVPSEIFGASLALRVDEMYGQYAENPALNGEEIAKSDADLQTGNGAAESPSGTDLTGWVCVDDDGNLSFSLEALAAYRTAAASKASPGFDVIDYGQEDYVFGDSDTDARHWSTWVLKALEDNRETLEALFNQ
ncbi:MAG: hypothetical protein Q4C10_05485 [Clostridia bacterium]|nr:hypothetical protein [Clostridia bacterium]